MRRELSPPYGSDPSRLVAAVGRSLTGRDPLRVQLQQCAEHIVRHVDAAFARVWTLNARDNVLELQASAGLYTHVDGPHARVPVGAFKIGLIAQERKPHLTNDVQSDPRVSNQQWARSEGMVAFAGFPLIVDGRVVGVIGLFARRALSNDVLETLESVADMIAVGIDRAHNEALQLRVTRKLAALADASLAISRANSLDQVLQAITDSAAQLIGAHQAVTSLTVNSSWVQAINAVYLSDKYEAFRKYDAKTTGKGIYSWLCERGDSVRMTQAELEAHPRFRNFGGEGSAHPPMRGWLACALTARDGRNLGLVQLTDKREGDFTEDDLDTLEQLARFASVAVENASLSEKARQQAEELELINRLGTTLAAELDAQKLVQAITDIATELCTAQFGAFFYNVIDEQGASYMLYTISGVPRERFSKFPMPRATQMFAPTFRGEGVIRLGNVRTDPRFGKNAPHHGLPRGHLPVVSYLAVPVKSRSGKVIGGLFFGHEKEDVFTERHERLLVGLAAQAAVAMDNARLFDEAQRLIRALEASNRELDQFAYVASHDLKAPLRGISSLSQWIEEDLGDVVTGDAKNHLNLLRGRVNRMEALIDGILNYSRAGRTYKAEPVDLGQLLAETVELVAPPPGARIELPSDLPTLNTEKIPLQQVFLNLIENGLKHAARADPVVQVRWAEENGQLKFSVQDNGQGIDPAFHDRIWGLFQTLQPRDKVEGTGIGLAVVKKVVESRGGRATVESREGSGATFHFTWPDTRKPSR